MNDGVLVEALRARDPGALAALYDTYAESLYRYCRTLLAGPDAAQVALRDTLIAAEALVGSLADPGRFRPWLYALARGECMRRRTPRQEDGPDAGPDAGPGNGPAPVATVPFPGLAADGAEADLRLVASSAVGALSAEDREVLELAARHGMAGQDLPAVLGTGERYAEALLAAATERLRETVTAEIMARRATHDCERASHILAGFAGELTPQVRAQLTRHIVRCETCGRQRVRQISPAKVFGLLPQVAMPETLRVRVLSSFIDPELVPYRRYVAKRVGRLTAAGFPRAGRREGRLAQAVAGAVAALAAVATIALVFAQFAGDLREQAADTIAPLRLPTAEAPASPSGSAEGGVSPEGSEDETGAAAGRSPAPPVSRDLAEPAEPVAPVLTARPVALPRPAPLPAPVPPSAWRPHRPAPHDRPSGHPTGASSPSPHGPGASPSGPTPIPTTPGTSGTPGTPGTEPGSGGPGSGGPGSGGPGSGRPPWGGPPPAHWPGHRPPWRDHQHHPRFHPEWPPAPVPPHRPFPVPSHRPSRDHGGPSAVPPGRGGRGGGQGRGLSGEHGGGQGRGLGGGHEARHGEGGEHAQGVESDRRAQGGPAGGRSRYARPGGVDRERPGRPEGRSDAPVGGGPAPAERLHSGPFGQRPASFPALSGRPTT